MKIVEAAIKFPNGKIYTGKRHHDCFYAARLAGEKSPKHEEQGFITDTGEFVGREAAALIAEAAGQIKELKYHDTRLFSEDLY